MEKEMNYLSEKIKEANSHFDQLMNEGCANPLAESKKVWIEYYKQEAEILTAILNYITEKELNK